MADCVSAIFLDRDGVINIDNGYVHKINDFQFIDGITYSLQALKKMGFILVVITNQSGIARGLYTEEQFLYLTEWLIQSLSDYKVDLDGVYYCPHHPKATIKALRQECKCRKPKPGMLLEAQQELHIDMASSYMVGDRLSDLLAGQEAGVGTKVLIPSNKTRINKAYATADWAIDNLKTLPLAIKQQKDKKY